MRYLRLLGIQLRASLVLGLQYRADFAIEGLVDVVWMMSALVPLLVVFHVRKAVAGWSFGQALMVTGWFTFLEGVLEGSINPSLVTVVDHVRKGTFDFVLLKPVDAQFLVSTSRFQPWRGLNVLTAMVVFGWAFHLLGRAPSTRSLALAAVMMVAAVTVLYSLWIATVSAVFYFVRVDNLSHLFSSLFDFARWPVGVFPRGVRLVFTFVLPLALMTTYPAQALLDELPAGTLAAAIAGAIGAFFASRLLWVRSVARYTSAGG
jgi:ABC-2 type transport system permease protein